MTNVLLWSYKLYRKRSHKINTSHLHCTKYKHGNAKVFTLQVTKKYLLKKQKCTLLFICSWAVQCSIIITITTMSSSGIKNTKNSWRHIKQNVIQKMVMAELMDKKLCYFFLFFDDFLLSALSTKQLFKYLCVCGYSTDKYDDDYDKQENWKLLSLLFFKSTEKSEPFLCSVLVPIMFYKKW